MDADLILQVIPPVRPSLVHASFLLNDRVLDSRAQNAEGHGHTVIIIAVDASVLLELFDMSTIDFETILKLFGLNPKFGCLSQSDADCTHGR